MSTYFQSREEGLKDRKWHLVDATDLPLGRLASEIAVLIRGKHKTTYTPHTDGGDFVIVLNAEKIRLTGKKLSDKKYYHHTGFAGGIKEIAAGELLKKNPEKLITEAVKGMLPKGALGHQMINKLKVYAGAEHPHLAQTPEVYSVKYAKAN